MYKAIVNNDHQFEIDGKKVNGSDVDIDMQLLPDGKYHLLLNNQSMTAEVVSINRNSKTVELSIDQQSFSVVVEDDFDLLLSKMGMDKSAAQVVKEIKSPMPGLVLDILVKSGDTVEEGQTLMVLEAMKMENVIAAPSSATVSEVLVKKQEKVDKNQILIKFD